MLVTGAFFALVAIASAYPEPDLDAYPELERDLEEAGIGYRRHHYYGGHPHQYRSPGLSYHSRGRHHKMALTHHSAAPRLNWSPDDDGSVPLPEKAQFETTPMALPGRHPSVEKALDGMSNDLQDLKVKQVAAKETRGELEGKVSEVVHHMNDAMSIKHAMQKKEAQLRVENSKLQNLEREATRVDETRSSLVNSLHRVLEPKLQFARERLEKKETFLAREEQAAKGWQEKKDQLHEHALELLKEKKVAHQSLLEAEHEVAEAKKKEEMAARHETEMRHLTGQEVQSFRYAETRAKAELAHMKAAEESTFAAKESVKKLNNVLEVESEKVEESMEVNKMRIHQRMEAIEASREKAKMELEGLEHRYREWQETQKQRAQDVVRKSQDTAVAAEAYADRQKQVLDTAQKKVVQDAEAKSDWAWESGFSNNEGFVDSNPSLSD